MTADVYHASNRSGRQAGAAKDIPVSSADAAVGSVAHRDAVVNPGSGVRITIKRQIRNASRVPNNQRKGGLDGVLESGTGFVKARAATSILPRALPNQITGENAAANRRAADRDDVG